MAVQPAVGTIRAQAIGRHDEAERASPRQVAKQRCDEAEGRGDGAFGRGHDLMQGAAGKSTVGQVGIDRRQTEGQRRAPSFDPGHEPAQFRQDRGAVARQRKDVGPGHCGKPMDNPMMFSVCSRFAV